MSWCSRVLSFVIIVGERVFFWWERRRNACDKVKFMDKSSGEKVFSGGNFVCAAKIVTETRKAIRISAIRPSLR